MFLSNVNECISSYCEKFPGNKNWENIMQYLASIKLNEYSKCVELPIQCSQFIINRMNKNEIFVWVYTRMCMYMCTQFLKYLWNESIENRSRVIFKNISALVFMFLKEQIVKSSFRNKKFYFFWAASLWLVSWMLCWNWCIILFPCYYLKWHFTMEISQIS